MSGSVLTHFLPLCAAPSAALGGARHQGWRLHPPPRHGGPAEREVPRGFAPSATSASRRSGSCVIRI